MPNVLPGRDDPQTKRPLGRLVGPSANATIRVGRLCADARVKFGWQIFRDALKGMEFSIRCALAPRANAPSRAFLFLDCLLSFSFLAPPAIGFPLASNGYPARF